MSFLQSHFSSGVILSGSFAQTAANKKALVLSKAQGLRGIQDE